MSSKDGIEIRYNQDGTVDEIVGYGFFHLEQMNNDEWCLIFGNSQEGPYLLSFLYSKKEVVFNLVENHDCKHNNPAQPKEKG